jgi:hypothetical protein
MILWYTDPLLGNDHKTNNERTAAARQWPTCSTGSTVGGGVSYVICSKATSHDQLSSVQLVS